MSWIDGRPLLSTIEQYRRDLFTTALYTFRADDSTARAASATIVSRSGMPMH